jgi:hypothetical protein
MMNSFLYGGMAFTWILYALFWIQPAAYLVLRWRAYREGGPADPHLGMKSMLYYFKTLGFQALLAAGFCLIYGIMSSINRGDMIRLAVGLMLGGGIIYGLTSVLIDKHTNTRTHPAAARLFNGFNLLVTGLVGSGALVFFFVMLLARGTPGDSLKWSIALTVVYCAAAAVQFLFLLRNMPTTGEAQAATEQP